MGGGVGVFDKECQSAPVNCKADRLSAFCASRAKMSAIRTRHDKTALLVTKGDNGHFRTLRGITYKKILNKSNAILAACLHLLATFGLECRAFACKKKYHRQKSGGEGGAAPPISKVGGKRPPLPLPIRRLCLGDLSVETVLVGSTVYETHFTNIKITSNRLPFFKIQTATVIFHGNK